MQQGELSHSDQVWSVKLAVGQRENRVLAEPHGRVSAGEVQRRAGHLKRGVSKEFDVSAAGHFAADGGVRVAAERASSATSDLHSHGTRVDRTHG